ncbi:nucleotide pyrophosphohydrolase [Neobacillus cucumis]|uniref:nucleotide pyrophosphohydrolase n=1 Tax=Neobacillus cucumis TaxID=1740721 RepID=UPI001964DCB4|nr:nucleotide pyrophosphohydrolase [Neobacillus cucumis]MBM7651260.1 NTP pyrophosphatase (non-canonical NTP hydrolase) [Neobacillus cucumis]
MKEIQKKILSFRDERDWKKYHNEKDLAISISLEASELLENFQWKTTEEALAESRENIKDEIADILIYLIQLADKMDINIDEEVTRKLIKNAEKYPVKKKEETVK